MDQRLSQNTIYFMKGLVERFMQRRQAFTSLDVANLTKKEGYFARNRMVAEWLRTNAIQMSHEGGYMYNQSLIRVQSKADGETYAYCYHHMDTDPDTYLDRDQNPKPYTQQNQPAPTRDTRVGQTFGYAPGYVPPNGGAMRNAAPHHSVNQRRDSKGRFC